MFHFDICTLHISVQTRQFNIPLVRSLWKHTNFNWWSLLSQSFGWHINKLNKLEHKT